MKLPFHMVDIKKKKIVGSLPYLSTMKRKRKRVSDEMEWNAFHQVPFHFILFYFIYLKLLIIYEKKLLSG